MVAEAWIFVWAMGNQQGEIVWFYCVVICELLSPHRSLLLAHYDRDSSAAIQVQNHHTAVASVSVVE